MKKLGRRNSRRRVWSCESLESRQLLAGDTASTADLEVSLRSPQAEIFPGDIVRYYIRATNNRTVKRIVVSAQLDLQLGEGLRPLEWHPSPKTEIYAGALPAQIEIPRHGMVNFVVYAVAERAIRGDITSTIQIRHLDELTDPEPSNNRASVTQTAPLRPHQQPEFLGYFADCFEQTYQVGELTYFVGTNNTDMSPCYATRAYASSGWFGGDLNVTDGTREGTYQVKEIRTYGRLGADAFLNPQFEHIDDVLYFAADDGLHGRELWRSDGTAEGTYLVKNILPDPPLCEHPSHGCRYYRGMESEITGLTVAGSRLFFTADDGVHGQELWISDGTEAGTYMVKDIAPGDDSAFRRHSSHQGELHWSPQVVEFKGHIYFVADDRQHGREIWRTDGTEAGTQLFIDIRNGGSTGPFNLRVEDEQLRFEIDRGQDRYTWVSDGTVAGTKQTGPAAPEVDPPPAIRLQGNTQGQVYALLADTSGTAPNISRRLITDLSVRFPGAFLSSYQIVGDQALLFLDGEFPHKGGMLVKVDLYDHAADFAAPLVVSQQDRWVELRPDVVRHLNNRATYVFSTTLQDGPGDDVWLVTRDYVAPGASAVTNTNHRPSVAGSLVDVTTIPEVSSVTKLNAFTRFSFDLGQLDAATLGNEFRYETTRLDPLADIVAQVPAAVVLRPANPNYADREYYWDLDNDGVYDRVGNNIPLTLAELAEYGIASPGDHKVAVRMNDRVDDYFSHATISVLPEAAPGDFSGDGQVDDIDFAILREHFGRPSPGDSSGELIGDLNSDGRLDFADFLVFRLLFGDV